MNPEQVHKILRAASKNTDVKIESERTEDGQMTSVSVTGDRRRITRRHANVNIASALAYEAWKAGCVA